MPRIVFKNLRERSSPSIKDQRVVSFKIPYLIITCSIASLVLDDLLVLSPAFGRNHFLSTCNCLIAQVKNGALFF